MTHAKGVTPRSSKFTALVLGPRRITINDTNSITPSAFHHFETRRPPEGYRTLHGLAGVNLWITADDDWIRRMTTEYKEMKALGLCEEEFATFAKERLLRPEWRSDSVSEERQWRPEGIASACVSTQGERPLAKTSHSRIDGRRGRMGVGHSAGLHLLAFPERLQPEVPVPDPELCFRPRMDYMSISQH